MTADITDAEIEYVATAMSAAGPEQSGHILSGLARAALEAAAEIGWGRKPTRSEFADAFRINKFTYYVSSAVYYGFAVEDPEPEWEPTDDAVKELADITIGTTDAATILKHIRANPHLIGMGEVE